MAKEEEQEDDKRIFNFFSFHDFLKVMIRNQ
jgi:hypothetical protein